MNQRVVRQQVSVISILVLAMAAAGWCQSTRPATQPAREVASAAGRLVKVEGKALFFRNAPSNDDAERLVYILTDDATHFVLNGENCAIDDLKPEMMVTVRRTPHNDPAGTLLVYAMSKSLDGLVKGVEGKHLTIMVNQPGSEPREIIVTADDKTEVAFIGYVANDQVVEPHMGTFDEIKPGMRVKIIPDTGTAEKIYIGPNRPHPGNR